MKGTPIEAGKHLLTLCAAFTPNSKHNVRHTPLFQNRKMLLQTGNNSLPAAFRIQKFTIQPYFSLLLSKVPHQSHEKNFSFG